MVDFYQKERKQEFKSKFGYGRFFIRKKKERKNSNPNYDIRLLQERKTEKDKELNPNSDLDGFL